MSKFTCLCAERDAALDRCKRLAAECDEWGRRCRAAETKLHKLEAATRPEAKELERRTEINDNSRFIISKWDRRKEGM